MTIDKFWNYVNKNKLYETINVSDLEGKRIAVDMYATIYAHWTISIKRYMQNNRCITVNIEEVEKIWLNSLFKNMTNTLSQGIIPVIVIDGDKDPLKLPTLEARGKCRGNAKEAITKLDGDGVDFERVVTLTSQSTLISVESKNKAIDMFIAMGLPYVYALGEAERTCSLMNNEGIVYAVDSPDSDCICCGAELVIKSRDRVVKNGRADDIFVIVRKQTVLDSLNVDFRLFQDLCILMGTDFNPHFKKGCGWVKGISLMKKYGSIARMGEVDDVSHLNYKEVYKRFEIVPWQNTVKNCCLDVRNGDFNKLDELSIQYGKLYIDIIKELCT